MSDTDCKSDVDTPCPKKIKVSHENGNGVNDNQLELKDFIPEKILNNNTNRKTACIQGTFKGKDGVAIIIFEKNAFKEEELTDDTGYFSAESKLSTCFQNDIYGNYECLPRASLNESTKVANSNKILKPWVTPELLQHIHNREKFSLKCKKNPDDSDLSKSFKRYRNYCNSLLKKAKRQYEQNKGRKAEYTLESVQVNYTFSFPQPPSIIGALDAAVKTSIIYPATEKHITKYSAQELHLIVETPDLYEKLTLPHIEKEQFTLQWAYNILEGKCEQDRIIYDNKCEKEGFVLLPDLKWDGVTKETLYMLALVRQRGIKSLRDLDASHLPLLKTIRDEGKKSIYEKYKIPGSQLRIYLHYQPSFYHLHVHFTYLRHEAPGIYAEKSHILDSVISNIEMMGDYYKKATLPFIIREMDNIFNVYETNGHLQRIKPNIENIELIDK